MARRFQAALLTALFASSAALPATFSEERPSFRGLARRLRSEAQSLLTEETESDGNDCRCVNWKDALKNHNVTCGDLGEVPGGKIDGKLALGAEFCEHFYQVIDSNFCFQSKFGVRGKDQWCYVSSSCKQPSAKKISDSLSWKTCGAQDDMTLAKTPHQLVDISMKQNLDILMLVKNSYPFHEKMWSQVKPYFSGHKWMIRDAALKNELDHIVARGEPMVFHSKNGQPPFSVVMNQEVCTVEFTNHFVRKFGKFMLHPKKENLWEHPSDIHRIECSPVPAQ